jgi:hypothetical protein
MTAIQVFDPAMCCSTGICGTSVDPRLARFAADLAWLKARGASVVRYNLSQQPSAFVEHPEVVEALEVRGEASLPIVRIDGEIRSSGTYPSRAQLAEWARISADSCPTPPAVDCDAGTTSDRR